MNAGGYGRPERDSMVSRIRGRCDPFPVPDDRNRFGRNEERQPCIFYGISGSRPRPVASLRRKLREGPPDSLVAADAEPVNLPRTIVRCFRIKSCGFEFAAWGLGQTRLVVYQRIHFTTVVPRCDPCGWPVARFSRGQRVAEVRLCFVAIAQDRTRDFECRHDPRLLPCWTFP